MNLHELKKYRVTVVLSANHADWYDLLVETIEIHKRCYRIIGKRKSDNGEIILDEKELEYFYFPINSTKIIPLI